MFILDTNVVSELRKARGGRANPGVVSWASAEATRALYISAVTVLELELGVLQIERRDVSQGALLRSWMNSHVMPAFASRVLPVDEAVALKCASLHVPNRRSDRDCLIAATALIHGYTIVTRNVRDFEGTGAAVLNPWTP